MNEKFTEQHRESTEALVNTLHEILFPAISASRQISISTLDELSKKLNFSASEALEHRLIDGTAYEYEGLHNSKLKTSFSLHISPFSLSYYFTKVFGREKL